MKPKGKKVQRRKGPPPKTVEQYEAEAKVTPKPKGKTFGEKLAYAKLKEPCLIHPTSRISRTVYERRHGAIPIQNPPLQVLHKCDQSSDYGPCCIRDSHLWLGTKEDNHEDAKKKGRLLLFEEGHTPAHKGKHIWSAAERKAIAKRVTGNKNAVGHVVPKEAREAISAKLTGRTRPKEVRRRISTSLRGNTNALGYTHTEVAIKKISAANIGNTKRLGKKMPQSAKDAISAASMGNTRRLGYKDSEETKLLKSIGAKEAWARRKAAKLKLEP